MERDLPLALTDEFNDAFADLSAARRRYDEQPRDPERIAALGAARVRLEAARRAMDDERRRLGIETPWRVAPAKTDTVDPPPLWSIDQGPNA